MCGIPEIRVSDEAPSLHYRPPLHLERAYAPFRPTCGMFSSTDASADMILSLGPFPEIRESRIARVADTIREFSRER